MAPTVTLYHLKMFTEIDTDDISDVNLKELLPYGMEGLMSDIGIRHELVQIKYIDAFRKNTINGTNTDFYVPDSWDKYLGDRDGDLEINTDDVEVWEYTNTKTRSQLTVSSLDEYGHVTVSTAPASGSELYASYIAIPLRLSNRRMIEACCLLTASLAYRKFDPSDFKMIGYRGIKLSRERANSSAEVYNNRYKALIHSIMTSGGGTGVRVDATSRHQYHEPITGYNEPKRQ